MFFEKYIPEIERIEIELKDRLSRDSQNESLKRLLDIIDKIKRSFFFRKEKPTDIAIIERLLNKDISSMEDSALREYIAAVPGLKDELLFYIDNKEDIESIKLYFEAEQKVKKIAKDFFKKHDSENTDNIN